MKKNRAKNEKETVEKVKSKKQGLFFSNAVKPPSLFSISTVFILDKTTEIS
jgi:hypothetical protein